MSDDCRFRSGEPVGKFDCGCSGKIDAYHCSHPEMDKIVSLNAVSLRSNNVKKYNPDKDGNWILLLPSIRVPTCSLCPLRDGATDEVKDFHKEYGISGFPDEQNRYQTSENLIPKSHSGLEVVKAAICANCPRVFNGVPTFCNMENSESCPASLWPDPKKIRQRSLRKRGCCG